MSTENEGERPVYRNRKYEPLIDKLCVRKYEHSDTSLFKTNKDLMIFAAMVGHANNKKEKLEKKPMQIFLRVYISDEKDGFIYLLSLLEHESANVLQTENLGEVIKLFEQYCNGGLSIIQSWLDDNLGDLDGMETLAEKILEQLVMISKDNKTIKVARGKVDF
tara:strand:+ start:185 stop:673 length:489 start_codon:yes stop_codon:yes gene_type:complete